MADGRYLEKLKNRDISGLAPVWRILTKFGTEMHFGPLDIASY